MCVFCHACHWTSIFSYCALGVVLRLGRNLEEPLLSKIQKEEQLSDDEVEVVEEWTLPSGQKKTVTETLDNSPPLYVPVIQRPADQLSTLLDGQREQLEHSVSCQVSCLFILQKYWDFNVNQFDWTSVVLHFLALLYLNFQLLNITVVQTQYHTQCCCCTQYQQSVARRLVVPP